MFFHAVRKPLKAKIKKMTDIKLEYDKVGLKPILGNVVKQDFMLNDFGWIRNDIQAFMSCGDVDIQRALLQNLEVVTQSGANQDMTIQDLYDSIIPNNVQTPADIQRFGRVLESRYQNKIDRTTLVKDLKPIVKSSDKPVEQVEVNLEV